MRVQRGALGIRSDSNIEVGAIRRVARFRGLPLFGGTGILPVIGWKPVPPCRVAPTKAFGFIKALSLIAALFISACGGGGGGGSATSPSSTIAFSGSSSGYNVYMAQNMSQGSGNVLAIDIKLDNVSNVYGAAFDVDFDSSKMTYSSYSAGSFLESGGNSVSYQAATQSGNSGKVLVGISRQGAVSGNSGSGTLVTLKFNVTSGGSVSFSNSSLVDSSGNIISASWSSGGTVTVQ